MMAKVTRKRFLEWYYSDQDDMIMLANMVYEDLITQGECRISVEQIYDACIYIPGHITDYEGEDKNTIEFDIEDVELIY